MTVTVYSEPPFHVELPDDDTFRLQDCPAYKHLSGRHLKEMDFGWWDTSERVLWLLEIKDFQQLSREQELPQELIGKFRTKARDCLLLLSAAWLGTPVGRELVRSLPEPCRTWPGLNSRLKLLFVVRPPKKGSKGSPRSFAGFTQPETSGYT